MFRPRFDVSASSSSSAYGNQPQTPPRASASHVQPQSRLGGYPLPHLATPERRGADHRPFFWLVASHTENFPGGERLTRERFGNAIPDDEDAIAVRNLLAEGRRFAELTRRANLAPDVVQRLLATGPQLTEFAVSTGRYSDEIIDRHDCEMIGRPSNASEISDDPSVEQSRTPSPDHYDSTAASMFEPDLDNSFSLRDRAQPLSFLAQYQYLSPRESYDSRDSRYSVESDDASGFYDRPPSYDESEAVTRLDRLNRKIAEVEDRLARLSAASSDSVSFV